MVAHVHAQYPCLLESCLPCTCNTTTSFTLPKSGTANSLNPRPKTRLLWAPNCLGNLLPPRPLFPLQSVQCLHPFHQWWIPQHRNCFARMCTSSMMPALMTNLRKCLSTNRCSVDQTLCVVDLNTGWKWELVGVTLEVPFYAGNIRHACWILRSTVGIVVEAKMRTPFPTISNPRHLLTKLFLFMPSV